MSKEPDRIPRKALGKGLSALLPSRQASSNASVSISGSTSGAKVQEQGGERLRVVLLDQIQPNRDQPRENFDAEKIEELAQSIRANGLIQPITVMDAGEGRFTIIAGERRWRAASQAGLREIPVFVREIQPERLLEVALVENIQREDLNPVETANAFHRLVTEHGLSHEQIAERTGKDRSTVTNFIRLLKLSAPVLQELARETISVGHARALLNISDPELQFAICDEIVRRRLSVRETETFVKKLTSAALNPTTEVPKKEPATMDPNIRAALDDLALALGTKVRLVQKSGEAGKLEIEYYSQDDLDRIYAVIVKPS